MLEGCGELVLWMDRQTETERAQLVIDAPECMHEGFAEAQRQLKRVERQGQAHHQLHSLCRQYLNPEKAYLQVPEVVTNLILQETDPSCLSVLKRMNQWKERVYVAALGETGSVGERNRR